VNSNLKVRLKYSLLKEKLLNLKIVTNKDIWDFIIICHESDNNSVLKIYESLDNYFYCGFYHIDKLIQFRIKIEHNLVGLWSHGVNEHSYNIECWCDNNSLPDNLFKEFIKPIIRESKLNLIGI
jgi:hypothetical protein